MDEFRWSTLVRVFSGESSPEEVEELERWVGADHANAELVESLRALWERAGELPQRREGEVVWQRIRERTGLAAPAAADVHPITAARRRAAARPAPWQRPLLRVAAAVVLVIGAAALWRPAGTLVRDHVLNHTVATGPGERVQVALEDGTRVLLGVESRIRYPRHFRSGARDVWLQGAAYFEVAHDAARPFSVHTPDAVTRVLGTKFSVRDYAGGEPVRVVVAEGRVAVRPATAHSGAPVHTAILTRGQAVELPAPGLPAVVQPADTASDLKWTRGVLAFHDAPVPHVLAEIGRWYDVRIEAPDSALSARHLTITFTDEPLDTILQEIATALNARIERRGRVILLIPAVQASDVRPIQYARKSLR